MKDRIELLTFQAKEAAESAVSLDEMKAARQKYFGKSGDFASLMKGLRDIPNEDKPKVGNLINSAKAYLESIFDTKEKSINEKLKVERLRAEYIDISIPSTREYGSLHPLTIVKNEILDIFIGLGFKVKEGPEIETDYFNFQAMNIPLDHPARDMQDTFYITDNILLRTHTSPMQARVMLDEKPPIKILVPGKVYRSDDDATHSPMFHQIEGLYVDKGVTLSDLKGTLDQFAKALFSEKTHIRFRPSYFPFTEPSVEVDVTCSICGGKGCRICKGTGWIEILGAGVVNPAVLINCNVDPKVYSGFAFGMGIERITMIRYGIPDMRILFENDIRFLKQYR